MLLPRFLDKGPGLEQPSNLDLSVQNYVDECLISASKNAAIDLGRHGGYFEMPMGSIESIPFWIVKNDSFIPTQDDVENEFSKYIHVRLLKCLDDFSVLKEEGFEITPGPISLDPSINENSITVKLEYPLSIQKGSQKYTLSAFSVTIENARLKSILEIARQISQNKLNKASTCISCIYDLATMHDVFVDIGVSENHEQVITITDKHTAIDGTPYLFIFAYALDEVSCTSIPDYLDNEERLGIVSRCLNNSVEEAFT